MSSDFDTDFATAGAPNLLTRFGQPASYTPAGGEAVSLSGAVSDEQVQTEEDSAGRTSVRTCRFTISRDPDGEHGGVADPAINATVTIDGDAWEVRDITELDAVMATVLLVRVGRSERSRPGYRHRDPLDYRR